MQGGAPHTSGFRFSPAPTGIRPESGYREEVNTPYPGAPVSPLFSSGRPSSLVTNDEGHASEKNSCLSRVGTEAAYAEAVLILRLERGRLKGKTAPYKKRK